MIQWIWSHWWPPGFTASLETLFSSPNMKECRANGRYSHEAKLASPPPRNVTSCSLKAGSCRQKHGTDGNKQNVIYHAEESKSHGENMQEENTKLIRTELSGFWFWPTQEGPEPDSVWISTRPVLTKRAICFHPTRLLWTGCRCRCWPSQSRPGRTGSGCSIGFAPSGPNRFRFFF